MKAKHIGLYFGTFNPVHIGHLVIANHFVEFTDLEEVWLVVTPHNPHKERKGLLANHHRYQMVSRAIEAYPRLRASDIELSLPRPSYTVNTLAHLGERYPGHRFALIMGEDNLTSFHKWKNYEVILKGHHIYVYPRLVSKEVPPMFSGHPHIHAVDAPIMEISATFLRQSIREGKNIRPLMPEAAWKYLDEMNFYK